MNHYLSENEISNQLSDDLNKQQIKRAVHLVCSIQLFFILTEPVLIMTIYPQDQVLQKFPR